MYKTLRKGLLLVLLVVSVVCGALFAVACDPTDDNGGNDAKVTYSVTVTLAEDVEGVTLTSLKAQWYSGTTAASDAIALSGEGKASVELDAGSYTVKLNGVPASAKYTEATVTAAAPNATIQITKVTGSQAPKLSTPTGLKVVDDILSWDAVENAVSYDIYADNVWLTSVDKDNEDGLRVYVGRLSVGTHSLCVVAVGDGENYSNSEKSASIDYTVEENKNVPAGGTEHWYQEGFGWHHVEGDPYTVSEAGVYYIPVEFTIEHKSEDFGDWVYDYSVLTIYVDIIEFTAFEEGSHSYIFSWDNSLYTLTYVNFSSGEDLGIDDDCLLYDDENGKLIFSLEQGEKVTVALQLGYDGDPDDLTEDDELGYYLTVESGDPISEGSVYLPIEVEELAGTHSAPVGYSKTEAYFALPENWDYNAFEVTFASDVKVYVLINGRKSEPAEITSGYELVPAEYSSTYIYVVGSASSQLSFTLTKVDRSGSTDKPIALTKDVEVSHNFADSHSMWYTFTPDASQLYLVAVNGTYVKIYTSIPSSDEENPLYEVSSDGKREVYLENGTKYYIELVAQWGSDVTLKITDPSNEAGGILNPIALNVGNYSADYSETDILYFTFTATYDGLLKFSHNAEYGVSIYLFSDANYSVSLGDPEYDGFVRAVSKGDVLYIYITSYNNVEFTLELKLPAPSNVKVVENVLSWDEVEGAAYYMIYEGDEIRVSQVEDTTYDLSELNLASGTHNLRVVARGIGSYLTSDKSEEVAYVVPYELGTDENGVDVVLDGTEITINLLSGVKTDTQYALVLDSAADNSEEDFHDYFTSGIYTVTYYGNEYKYDAEKYVGVYRELDWTMALITFNSEAKSFTLSVVMPAEASVLYVKLSLVEMPNESLTPMVVDLEVGEARQDKFSGLGTQWQYTFDAPNNEYYIVEIACAGVENAEDITFNNGEPLEGVLSAGKIRYEFLAEDEKHFEITITSNKEGLTDYTVTILQKACEDFYIGKALSVTVAGSTAQQKLLEKKFVSPVNAKYSIEMTGATTSQVYIRNESKNDGLIEWGGASTAEITLAPDEELVLGFYLSSYGDNQSFDIQVKISQLELVKEYLAPGEDPVSIKIGDSKDTAGEVALASEGFKSGEEYTIFLAMTTQMMAARASELTLYYNGTEIVLNITTSDDEYEEGYVGKFTYDPNANSLWVYNTHFNSAMKTKVSIIVKAEGLAVGGSITLNPEDVGDGYGQTAFQQGGKEIPLLIPSSGRYTITITPGAIGDYSKTFFYHDGTVKQQVNGSYTGYFEAGSTIRILVNGGGSSLNAPITVSLANP